MRPERLLAIHPVDRARELWRAGLCGSCGVRIVDGSASEHWHDALAGRCGYPRLSCQVAVEGEVRLTIPETVVWGRRV